MTRSPLLEAIGAAQEAHAAVRARERLGLSLGAAGLLELARAIRAGEARWLRGSSHARHRSWWRVRHWTGAELVVCYDEATGAICTVLGPGQRIPTRR